ncbi:hypothetical protein QWY87_09100 [Lutimonas halocynthiae]|uniref:hypothetical protein n=1 Tax=Lutimonas halocynthiae TaxID=1446477 RepID=UPI0025B36E5B|nr:hypothetical protein [Lutimonas halocynthiae]MDN3642854.1 hypothetical protein [Lutimonas halocynthiae]
MKNFMLLFLFSSLSMISCGGDDDGGLPAAKNYSIEYEVKTTGDVTVNKIQYRGVDAEWVIIENPTIPWEISLTIPAGKALEAAAYGDIPFEGVLTIESRWSPMLDGQSSESETLKNDTPNSVINNGKVEIEGRSLPRY